MVLVKELDKKVVAEETPIQVDAQKVDRAVGKVVVRVKEQAAKDKHYFMEVNYDYQ